MAGGTPARSSGCRGLPMPLRSSPCSCRARETDLLPGVKSFDTDKRDEVVRQRPAPIEHSMVTIKLSVMDRVTFTLQRVSQIVVSRESCGVYQISRRRVW